jgi:SHS2 domain-containing protein
MNKNIIIILLIVVAVIFFASFWMNKKSEEETKIDSNFSLEDSRDIAKNWIKEESLTYVFDGDNLSLVDESSINDNTYSFLFSFESRAAGYGDRSNEMLAQVVTPHEMEVLVEEGNVIRAVTDNVFSEISGEMIDESENNLVEELTINVYFIETIDGQEEIVAVEREIPYTLRTAQASVEELLKGPKPSEIDKGLSTSIAEGVELNSLHIENGVAYVDFNEALDEGIAGSAWVTSIRNQIAKTLSQFETVDEVVISIDGETENILQP